MVFERIIASDKQGNILSAYRMANEDELDLLNLTYEGNQLIKVTDYAEDGICYSAKHYQDGENAQKEMFYDKNGALVADFDRNTSFLRFSLDDHCVWHNSCGASAVNKQVAYGYDDALLTHQPRVEKQ